MNATPFDTLKLASSLRGVATAIAEAFQDQVATKTDLLLLEQRLTIKVRNHASRVDWHRYRDIQGILMQ